MVLTEQTGAAEVIFHEKKKYKRVVVKNGVEWRRFKTNHQVTKEQHEILESEYVSKLPNASTFYKTSPVVNRFSVENDSHRRILEDGLVKASENGKYILSGIKRVKEITGWGLKDSKEYVDLFFERKKKYNKPVKSIKREEVIKKLEEFMRDNERKLACVKYLIKITDWSIKDSKDFFEGYIKWKEAKELVKSGF
jgi:ribosomal protein L7/L12